MISRPRRIAQVAQALRRSPVVAILGPRQFIDLAGFDLSEVGAPGFEMKLADAPALTRSMAVALDDLGLDHLFVIYPGDKKYSLAKSVMALPLGEVATLMR